VPHGGDSRFGRGCTALPPQAGAPVEERSAAPVAAALLAPPPLAEPSPIAEPRRRPHPHRAEAAARRPRSRWVPAELERPAGLERRPQPPRSGRRCWPAARGPLPGWNEACARALLDPPAGHEAARRWLMHAPAALPRGSPDGNAEGLITGYFEPTLEASRRPRGAFRVPLYAPPDRAGHAQAVLHAPAARHAAGRDGQRCAAGDRLGRGPAGRLAAAGAGLGPAALRRADGRAAPCAWRSRRTTSSPTSRSAAG
jgi:hypothetical protein